MEATRNCTKAIDTTQEAGQQANSVIDSVYEGYISYLVVAWYPVRPNITHVCVILHFVIPHVRHIHLGLRIGVSLKGRTACIWSFGCGFTFATITDVLGLDYHLVQLFFCNY